MDVDVAVARGMLELIGIADKSKLSKKSTSRRLNLLNLSY